MEYYKTTNRNQITNYSEICVKYFGYKNDGFVLDVGAHDGYTWSNSYPLISIGWCGLLIEPHPVYASKIRDLYKDVPLGNIIVVEKAISNYVGEATLHDAGSLTTLKPEMLEAYEQISWAKGHNKNKTYTVKIDKLNNVLYENNIKPNFDIFILDCEGSEEETLEFFDIKYWKPKMVIVETLEIRDDAERSILDMKNGNFYKYCDDLFIGFGYKKIYVDHVNTIYVL